MQFMDYRDALARSRPMVARELLAMATGIPAPRPATGMARPGHSMVRTAGHGLDRAM